MKIIIETIPHSEQRYPTVGDWTFINEDNISIRISNMNNWKYEFLVAFHELIEVMLCKDRNIDQKVVDNFDIEYEANRMENDFSEPGDSPSAPYNKEHAFATKMERKMAKELNVDWREYDAKVSSL
jgi:hypothetical protein